MPANRFQTLLILVAAGALLSAEPVFSAVNPLTKVVIADESYQEVAGCRPGCNRGDDVFFAPNKAEVARKLDNGKLYFERSGPIVIAVKGLHAAKVKFHYCDDMSGGCSDLERDIVADAQGQEVQFVHWWTGIDFAPLFQCVDSGKTADVVVDRDAKTLALTCK